MIKEKAKRKKTFVSVRRIREEGVDFMMLVLLVSLVAAVIVLLLVRVTWSFLKKGDEEKSVLEMRKAQSTSSFRENALKRKLEGLVEGRAKKGKKIEIEELCLQAGFDMTYGEYRLIGYFTGIIFFIAIIAGLHNIFMAIVLCIIGNFIPGQLIHAIRNSRVSKMEKQVGSFMRLVVERYSSTKDFSQSIQECTKDFKGQEPMYSELQKVSADLNIGIPVSEAMRKLCKRVGNPYLSRMTDYYEIASDLGTTETRENLLKQALIQYEENRSMKSRLRNELNGPVREAYLMVAMVPFISIYMASSTPDYKKFMLQTMMGQISISVILVVILGVIWFINKQIGKPLD